MKRERLHDWLVRHCPAYKNLGAEEQALVLDEAIAAHQVEAARKHRQLVVGLTAVVVGAWFIWWWLDESPLSMLGALFPALLGLGGARIFVAEYVERKVRERAEIRSRGFILAQRPGD